MTAPLKHLEENVKKLEEAAADIRLATREAHEQAQELKQLKKEVRSLIDETTDMLSTMPGQIQAAYMEHMAAQVAEGLASYKGSIRDAIDKACEEVQKTFVHLTNTMMYGDPEGKGKLLLETWEERRPRS